MPGRDGLGLVLRLVPQLGTSEMHPCWVMISLGILVAKIQIIYKLYMILYDTGDYEVIHLLDFEEWSFQHHHHLHSNPQSIYVAAYKISFLIARPTCTAEV